MSAADSSLPFELAGELGRVLHDRSDIVGLAQQHANAIDIADLPQGSARAAWIFILVELVRRQDRAALEALIAEGEARTKRVDWRRFRNQLAEPERAGAAPAAEARTLWSHLDLDLRWASNDEVCRISSESQLLDATMTLQWAGARPPDPTLDLRVGWLLGRSQVANVQLRDEPGTKNLAKWKLSYPVSPRLTTRRIAARASNQTEERTRRRFLTSSAGNLLSLGCWLAAAGFLLWWLTPLGAPVSITGLGIWFATFIGGWVLPRTKELWASLGWVTRAWETSAPIAVLLGVLGWLVPPHFIVIVTNHSTSDTIVNGAKLPAGEHATYLDVRPNIRPSDRLASVCPGDPRCPHVVEPVRGVRHFEVLCHTEKCQTWRKVSLADGIEGKVPLDWPEGFQQVSFQGGALRELDRIVSGDTTIELSGSFTGQDSEVVPVVVLAKSDLQISYRDGGKLDCTLPRRVGTISAAASTIVMGRTRSVWKGASPARACFGTSDVIKIELTDPKAGNVGLPSDLEVENVQINGSTALPCADLKQLRLVDMPDVEKLSFDVGSVQRIPNSRVGVTCVPPPRTTTAIVAQQRWNCTLGTSAVVCEPISVPPERKTCVLDSNDELIDKMTTNCRTVGTGDAQANKIKKRATEKGWTCVAMYTCN